MTIGEIPQSSALSEASPESLSELMSRDPLSYSKQDIQTVVARLREQRAKWIQAEFEGAPARAKRAPKEAVSITNALQELDF